VLRYILPLCFVALLSLPFDVRADEPAQSTPSVGRCAVAAEAGWTPQEVFVWNRACSGEIADFNTAPGYGSNLDPKRPEGLPENRTLSSAFIQTVLLVDKYRRALTRNGLRISGARFTDKLDLRNAELAHDLWLDHSLLEKGADFSGLRSTHAITLDGTRVAGPLDMYELQVGEDLSLRQSKLAQVNLTGAHVGQTLDLEQSKITSLNLTEAHVGASLWLAKSEISGDAHLTFARVGGALVLDGCRSSSLLDMNGIDIGDNLIMTNGQFANVAVTAAHVHGEFELVPRIVRSRNMA
jgi:uncharacterized protein YjbI with pentapeptide repeats